MVLICFPPFGVDPSLAYMGFWEMSLLQHSASTTVLETN